MTDLSAHDLHNLAYRLWRDCIRPAARYDRWLPSILHMEEPGGITDVVTTPIIRVQGIRHIVYYWAGDEPMWMVEQECVRGAVRQYEFGEYTAERICDIPFDWDEYEQQEPMDNAIIACSVELPKQMTMVF